MKVILVEDVPNLGVVGDLVEVKRGYARNYLLPRTLACEASTRNVRFLEHQKRIAAAKKTRLKAGADSMVSHLAKVAVDLEVAVGETGKLFGSVTTMDLADALAKQEVSVERKNIQLAEPIKAVGEYEVSVRLSVGVTGKFKVTVRPDAESLVRIAEAEVKAKAEAEAKAKAEVESKQRAEAAAKKRGVRKPPRGRKLDSKSRDDEGEGGKAPAEEKADRPEKPGQAKNTEKD